MPTGQKHSLEPTQLCPNSSHSPHHHIPAHKTCRSRGQLELGTQEKPQNPQKQSEHPEPKGHASTQKAKDHPGFQKPHWRHHSELVDSPVTINTGHLGQKTREEIDTIEEKKKNPLLKTNAEIKIKTHNYAKPRWLEASVRKKQQPRQYVTTRPQLSYYSKP